MNMLIMSFQEGLLPLITKPTTSPATLIDHIYSNYISTQVSSGIIITDVADHFGAFLIVKKKRPAY